MYNVLVFLREVLISAATLPQDFLRSVQTVLHQVSKLFNWSIQLLQQMENNRTFWSFFLKLRLQNEILQEITTFQLVLLPILSQDHRISPAHSQITFLIPLPPLQLGRACGPNTGREGQQKPHRTPKGSPHPLPMASRMRSSVMFCGCWTPQARSLMISQGCLTRSRTKISITKSTHLYIIILN